MICAPTCLPPSMSAANEASRKLTTENIQTDFVQCMKHIHEHHPYTKTPEDTNVCTFDQAALNHLQELHDSFNTSDRESIEEGTPSPTSKHIELIVCISAALFVLDNTLASLLKDEIPTIAHTQYLS